eukprot:160649-Chlamydomonas_euryale.AAC.5
MLQKKNASAVACAVWRSDTQCTHRRVCGVADVVDRQRFETRCARVQTTREARTLSLSLLCRLGRGFSTSAGDASARPCESTSEWEYKRVRA